MNYYSAAKATYGSKAKDPSLRNKMLEGICETGQVFYVPSGWWHLVVNLESSIAVTQNFVSPANLPGVLYFLKHRPDQVSGFKLKREMAANGLQPDQREYNGEEEDETGGGAVFARFCEALGRESPDVLMQGMKGLARLEMLEAQEMAEAQCTKKDKESVNVTLWSSLTANRDDDETAEADQQSGFSFGFDLAGEDEQELCL